MGVGLKRERMEMSMNGMKAICLTVALALTGCSMTSPMLKPDVATPAAWNEQSGHAGAAVSPEWWNAFGSAELQSLIERPEQLSLFA